MSYDPRSQMFAKVVEASQHPNGTPLYSVHLRYPRPIHGEVMTHREFSRNARSSRAVPVKTMLDEICNTPFIPWHWGKNQKGMQAVEECNEPVYFPNGIIRSVDARSREEAWLFARDQAVMTARSLMNAGYHKQIVNRLLEPFSWIDTLVTTASFSNFLWLREHKDAEPHLQDLAHMVAAAIQGVKLNVLEPGEWHLPYITSEDWDLAWNWISVNQNQGAPTHERQIEVLRKISAARCARISYVPFDGNPSFERELERYDGLVTSERVHASPLEHQATADGQYEMSADIIDAEGRVIKTLDPKPVWHSPELHGNLPGWIQNRKLIPGEYHA